LSNIEGELSLLTTLLKTGVCQRPTINIAAEEEPSGSCSADDQLTEPTPPRLRKYGHIVRGQEKIDYYHGPHTLFALCSEFGNTTLSEQRPQSSGPAEDEPLQSKIQERAAKYEAVKDLLARMCLEAGSEESVDPPSDHIPIRLPPKQFLLMVQAQFFQQADYSTDTFVQSCFCSNVERIYSRTFTSADETWAICFNTIIILVLGSEDATQGEDPLVGSQFALPFLLTIRTALSNPRVLMVPKIIHVQALALLVSGSDSQ
jgi:hypothetical protein